MYGKCSLFVLVTFQSGLHIGSELFKCVSNTELEDVQKLILVLQLSCVNKKILFPSLNVLVENIQVSTTLDVPDFKLQ